MHDRQAVRAAIIAALSSGVSAVDGRVSNIRLFARNFPQLPAIEVATPSERITRDSNSGGYTRQIDLGVTVYAAAGDGVEDALDAIGETVESVVTGAADVLDMTAGIDYGAPGEKRPARLDMIFTVLVVSGDFSPTT